MTIRASYTTPGNTILGSKLLHLKCMIFLCLISWKTIAFGLLRKHPPEPVPPEAHSLSAGLDAALMHEVFDLAQRNRAPNIEHHRQADDLGIGLEVPKGDALGQHTRLGGKVSLLKEFALTASWKE